MDFRRIIDRHHLHVDIYPVEQRYGYPVDILLEVTGLALAFCNGVVIIATGTRKAKVK
jgi:hypothetical protein